ncbi:MAG: tetratricopeptide repeat protein [Leptospiraceae bacterium]|nr:tetratricopeptide repeat protein [Leptospiraceae bacterium]
MNLGSINQPGIIRKRRRIVGGLLLALVCNTGLAAQSLYQSGKIAFSAREYDKAISLFQQAWRSNPADGNPLFYIGRVYDDQRQPGRAISWYKKAVKLQMDRDLRDQALWKVVLFLDRQQDWEALLEYSTIFLKYNQSAKIRGLHQKAEQNYDPVLASIQKDMDRASQYKKGSQFARALELYLDILGRRASYHPARWQAALLQMKLEQYDAANRNFRHLIQYDETAWEYYYKSAICLYQMHDYAESMDMLVKAADRNPDEDKRFQYHLAYLKGLLHYNLNEFPQACRELETARSIARQKSSARLLGTDANSQLECGNPVLADDLGHQALKKESDQLEARLALGRIALSKNDPDSWSRAISLLESVKDSKSADLHRSWTRLLAWTGHTAVQKQQYQTAILAFEKVQIDALTELARLQRQSEGKKPDMLQQFNFDFGLALMHTGQYQRALHLFDKLGAQAESRFMMARVHALQKNATDCKTRLLQSTELNESYWERAEQDPVFQKLMAIEPDFSMFIRTRNKPIEQEAPQKTEEEKPGPQNGSTDTQKSPAAK